MKYGFLVKVEKPEDVKACFISLICQKHAEITKSL
jgi:hypothetical protein